MPPLPYDAFRRQLRRGEFASTYYLHGDEDLLKDDALRDLLDAALDPSTRDFNCDRRRAADLGREDFRTLALTPPMMSARRAVVLTETEVIGQRRPRAQSLRAALLEYLTHPVAGTLLVLVQSRGVSADPDLARLASAVAFETLAPERVQRWIRHRAAQEGLALDEAGARHLQDVVGTDLPLLAAELAKLRAAVADGPVGAADVADFVGVRRGETIHDFVDAVSARACARAAGMVPVLLTSPGWSGVKLVWALGTALTGVALARAMLDSGMAAASIETQLFRALQAARPLNVRRWDAEASRWTQDAHRWTSAELEAALDELLRADRRLKAVALGGESEIVSEAVLAMAERGRRAA